VDKVLVEQPSPEAKVRVIASNVRAYEDRKMQEMRKINRQERFIINPQIL
jgi:hypothetical protein